MLIVCKECGKEISDQAISCPNCGFPIKRKGVSKKKEEPFQRLPNGFGNIKKLSGKRRNAFAAYPPTEDYHDNGNAVSRKAIGYYKTYDEAYNALVLYNEGHIKNDCDCECNKPSIKFKDLYEVFKKDRLVNGKAKRIAIDYDIAYRKLEPLHDRDYRSITLDEMQELIDNIPGKKGSREKVKIFLGLMFKSANMRDYAEKDYSKYLKIEGEENEKGEPFSIEALKLIWENRQDDAFKIMLILIYMGYRIGELCVIDINLQEKVCKGGEKNDYSRNRIVPIPEELLPMIKVFKDKYQEKFSPQAYRKMFTRRLEKLGILYENNKKHTPHDCRHTFSYLCDINNVDTLSKHMLMGHSPGKDIEMSVYGHRTIDDLKKEIDKIEIIR